MAQKGQSLLFICRSCRQHLQKSSIRTQSFSNTTRQRKTIPQFNETSSTELNDLLLTFRTKIFTPSALASHHRALIYKKSRHHILNNEPGVTVTLSNDEEVHLQPADRWDRPAKRKSLNQLARILGESNSGEMWTNLPPFLEGMRQAQENVPVEFLEKITRKANEQKQSGTIIRCAEKVKTTNFCLADPGVARELILGLHSRAASAGFNSKEEVVKAAKQAEHVVLMMEDKEHCGGKLKEGQVDMRTDLTVLAVLLELGAARAGLEGETTEHERIKVEGYAKRILAALDGDRIPGAVTTALEPAKQGQHLENMIPLWNGMKLALKVVKDQELIQKLQSHLAQIEKGVESSLKDVKASSDGKPRRALLMYDQLREISS